MEKTSWEFVVEVGTIRLSRRADKTLAQEEVFEAIRRHAAGDWGDLSLKLRLQNDENLEQELPVLSRFDTGHGEIIWIGTNPDQSLTTIMIESELEE